MRVNIGSSRDSDIAFYIQFAERQGQTVHTDVDKRGVTQYYVEVLMDGPVYRAPDVQFQRVRDQMISFDEPLQARRARP